MNKKNEEMKKEHDKEQKDLGEKFEQEQKEKDKEIRALKSLSEKLLKQISSCFSSQTRIKLSTGELRNISYIKSGDMLLTPNGPRKVAILNDQEIHR